MTGANDKAEDVARTIVGTHLSCPTDLHKSENRPNDDCHHSNDQD